MSVTAEMTMYSFIWEHNLRVVQAVMLGAMLVAVLVKWKVQEKDTGAGEEQNEWAPHLLYLSSKIKFCYMHISNNPIKSK